MGFIETEERDEIYMALRGILDAPASYTHLDVYKRQDLSSPKGTGQQYSGICYHSQDG